MAGHRIAVARFAKSEARSTNSETNPNDQRRNGRNELSISGIANLFRASCFGFRVSLQSPPMTSVRLEHICKVFSGDTLALRDINLEVRAGELFFLLGPSGCGKS